MIYITGDTHGNIDFGKLKKYFSKIYVTYDDYLIILGDAGIVWSEHEQYINEYGGLGLTVLFIDGNHENFELLEKFPVVTYKGAKCHRLKENIYHIIRGEIININGLTFFCMGGATSIDKIYREDRISWWEEENITNKDILNALNNLERVNYKVDYVLSHSAPSYVVRKMFGYDPDSNTELLEKLESQIDYKCWYFGHYHEERKWYKFRCFYYDILEMKITNETKPIKYNVLFLRDDYLINEETNRKVRITKEELPEWYFPSNNRYISLKGITDIAFTRSWTSNHLDKDACIYIHYHGKLRHNKLYEPVDRYEWDHRGYGVDMVNIVRGIEKYSPDIITDNLKAAINLNYEHYNQRKELIDFNNEDIVIRPFPEIKTPHYVDKCTKEVAKYAVYHGKTILSEFIKLESAKKFIEIYASHHSDTNLLRKIEGNDEVDFLYAYDISYNHNEWVFLKIIKE